jgi:hypothetical protein
VAELGSALVYSVGERTSEVVDGVVVFSVPGILLCVLVYRAMRSHVRVRMRLTAATGIVMLSPFPVMGHSPVILPLPFGVWLTRHMGVAHQAITASASLAFSLVLLGALSRWKWGVEHLRAAIDRNPRARRD